MYGYGLVEGEHAGLRTLEHGGGAFGFSTFVRLVPSQGFAVVAFVNGTASANDVADAATSAFLGVPEVGHARIVPPVSARSDYIGRYEDPVAALGRFHVYLDGDDLRVQLDGGQHPPFSAGLYGTFVRDARGAVEYFVTRVGVARRVH